jgi:hypothetical protein
MIAQVNRKENPLMRRLLLILCAAALAAAATAAAATASHTANTFVVEVCSTSVGWAGASVRVTPSGAELVRHLPVDNRMHVDGSSAPGCGAPDVGSLFYREYANFLPDGSNRAGCAFSMRSDYGDFTGECNGTLSAGHLVGHAGDGSTLTGTYQLIALAPDLTSSEYRLTITFESP